MLAKNSSFFSRFNCTQFDDTIEVIKMKILHTADIHLKEYGDERWKALEKILKAAEEEKVDCITIAGDFFDKKSQSDILRNPLRKLFSKFKDIKIFIVPGNHDAKAFPKGVLLSDADNVRVLTRQPFQIEEENEVVFIGVPYQEQEGEIIPHFFDILDEIRINSQKPKVLITHGTIVGGPYSFTGGFGEEERYNPIHYEDIKDSFIDYFALGHIHQIRNPLITGEGNKVVGGYPGSPVSIAEDETGKRRVIIVEIKKSKMSFSEKELDTFHWLREELTIVPYYEEESLNKLRAYLKNFKEKGAHLILNIGGYTIWEERELKRRVEGILEKAPKNVKKPLIGFKTIEKEYETLIQDFFRKLDKQKIGEELREQSKRVFCRALAEVK